MPTNVKLLIGSQRIYTLLAHECHYLFFFFFNLFYFLMIGNNFSSDNKIKREMQCNRRHTFCILYRDTFYTSLILLILFLYVS